MAIDQCGDDVVVAQLIQHIKAHQLKPGDRLPSIRECAEEWGMNWNVVREGFLQAQLFGLIRMHPRAGAFVAEFEHRRLTDVLASIMEVSLHHSAPPLIYLYDARLIIEKETVRRVAEVHSPEDLLELRQYLQAIEGAMDTEGFVKADEQFHLAIARKSGNTVLDTILTPILALLRPARLATTRSADDIADSHAMHRQLFQAFVNSDQVTAVGIITEHLSRRKLRMIASLYEENEK